MSNENHNDEIDLMQIFAMIKNAFRSFLKAIISIFDFYKKKAILFLILLVVGVIAGYFLDKNPKAKSEYVQEIIIAPHYDSTKYIYDLVEEIQEALGDTLFLSKLNITFDEVKDFRELTIEPLVKGTDVLDNLKERYENREFFKELMKAYDSEQVEEEKYRDFYKQHKLTFVYVGIDKTDNKKITHTILDFLKSNVYYKELAALTIQQNRIGLEDNKKTLKFIDEYLANLSKNPHKESKELVLSTRNDEIPVMSVASLLQKKEDLIEMINHQELTLATEKELFSVVYHGNIILSKKMFFSTDKIKIPLFLIGLVSLFYFLKYILRNINRFVAEEE